VLVDLKLGGATKREEGSYLELVLAGLSGDGGVENILGENLEKRGLAL
jgi:hypothetical protein